MFACQLVWARGKWCKQVKVLNADFANTLFTYACSCFSVLLLGALSFPHLQFMPLPSYISLCTFSVVDVPGNWPFQYFQPMFSQGAQTYYTVWFTLGLSLCDLSLSFFSSVKWRKEFWLFQVDVNSCKYLGCYQEHSNYSRNTTTFPLFSLEVLNSLWSLPSYWGRAPAETRAEGQAKTRC